MFYCKVKDRCRTPHAASVFFTLHKIFILSVCDLNAVDHLIRKVEKIDQAENLPVFICILGFPLNRHMDDLNRTG